VRVLPRAAPELAPPRQALQEAARRDIPQDAREYSVLLSLRFGRRASSLGSSVPALAGRCGRVTHCAILDLQVVGNKLPYKMPSGIFALSSVSYSVSSNLILWILVLIVCGISGQVYRCLLCLHGLLLQDGAPNERKIVKLCEYAAKNPLRIPKACDVAIL